MEVSCDDVKKVFLALINGDISRESADRWAYEITQASERKELIFAPPNDQDRIWEGVMYLYGVDLQEEPGQYLFSEEDIREAMLKKLGA